MAKGNDIDYPGIYQSTIGMIFMGTPHHGTSGTSLHNKGAIYKAIAAAQLHNQAGILNIFETGNEILDELVEVFMRLITLSSRPGNGPDTDVFCFYEQVETTVGKIVGQPDIKVSKVHCTSAGEQLPIMSYSANVFAP